MIASAGFLFIFSLSSASVNSSNSDTAKGVEIPEDVQAVLDNSCYGCHNSESQNEKAREKLSFDKLNDLKTFAMIGTLEGIQETVESAKMPPEKFLKKYPDNALSDAHKKTLLDWASETADKLAGE